MDVLSLIAVIAVVGLVVWGVQTLCPNMPPFFMRAIYVVAVIGLCFYVLNFFGVGPHVHLR